MKKKKVNRKLKMELDERMLLDMLFSDNPNETIFGHSNGIDFEISLSKNNFLKNFKELFRLRIVK